MDGRDFLSLLEDLFEVERGVIDLDTPLQGIPGWDSLTFVGLIARIDEEFGVTLGPQSVLRCRTIADLLDHIEGQMRGNRYAA
jgi:acyl carrier protein